ARACRKAARSTGRTARRRPGRRAARRSPQAPVEGGGTRSGGEPPRGLADRLPWYAARWLRSLTQRALGAIVSTFGADREHPPHRDAQLKSYFSRSIFGAK